MVLNQQKAIANRGNVGVCICFFDLDDFKEVNDTLGHHIGDIVLKRFASAVQSESRASDLLARFGGEKFVLRAMGTNLGGAKIAADRVRKVVQAIDFEDVAPALTVTVSGSVQRIQRLVRCNTLLD